MANREVMIWLMVITMMGFSSFGLVHAENYLDSDYEEPLFERYTKPTFGLDHESNKRVIDDGFKINNQAFDITNNFHSPFEEYAIEIGALNSFETTLFAPKGLKIQEFLFGIPKVGDAHLAEMRVEVWYDFDGGIKNFKVVQESDVIDTQHVILRHEKTKCQESGDDLNCDHTKISVIFLESLKDKVMAIKAIDFENRYQITYLNDGIDVSGESLNPKATKMIPSSVKYEGLIPVKQIDKYSSFWMAVDGRTFYQNDSGSFIEVGIQFERFQDKGEPKTRLHSGFGEIIEKEQKKALIVFNSSEITSELTGSYMIDFIIRERINDELKERMLEQEQIAQQVIRDSNLQARF